MRKTLPFLLLLFVLNIHAQKPAIIPEPVSMFVGRGEFTLNEQTAILSTDTGNDHAIDFFNQYLQHYYGFSLPVKRHHNGPYIRFVTRKTFREADKDAYKLNVKSRSIDIEGDTYAATFYGMQTLIQLLPLEQRSGLRIPVIMIDDYPRFKYRGMMLDVCRHFFPVSFVKQYIDYLALHKINYFHWHLTDDQGWRIEIKKYPLLTEKGAWRNGTITGRFPGNGNTYQRYGGYYTQEEIKEVVAYAATRHITVVPEIEMPGHGSAAIAAYPELSCFPERPTVDYFPKEGVWSGSRTGKQVQQTWGVFDDVFCAGKENTYRFLQDVIDEVLPLFPGPYIHIGGDECPKENWKQCRDCQRRMRNNGLKDEHELQSYLVQRMEKYINQKGRQLIGWDEILEGGLAPNATVMSWRGEKGGLEAAAQKHPVIMTPTSYVYFDYAQTRREDSLTIGGFNSLEKVYGYNPIPAEMPAGDTQYVLGAQANLWTEYITNPRKVQHMIFPRLAALSEVLWTPVKKKNLQRFEQKLRTQLQRYDKWDIQYSRAYFQLKQTIRQALRNRLYWELSSPSGETIWVKTGHRNRLEPYQKPVLIDRSTTLYAETGKGNLQQTITREISFNKATAKDIELVPAPSDKYPGEGGFTLVNGVVTDKKLEEPDAWIGYQGTAFTIVIDLGSDRSFNEVKLFTLQQPRSWVHAPGQISLSVSNNKINYRPVRNPRMDVSNDGSEIIVRLATSARGRYLRIDVPAGKLIPAGSPGAGNKAWVFLQEVAVN